MYRAGESYRAVFATSLSLAAASAVAQVQLAVQRRVRRVKCLRGTSHAAADRRVRWRSLATDGAHEQHTYM